MAQKGNENGTEKGNTEQGDTPKGTNESALSSNQATVYINKFEILSEFAFLAFLTIF